MVQDPFEDGDNVQMLESPWIGLGFSFKPRSWGDGDWVDGFPAGRGDCGVFRFGKGRFYAGLQQGCE